MSIEGQGHFFTIYFPGFVCLSFTGPRYQVSVYRTIGPLVTYAKTKTQISFAAIVFEKSTFSYRKA